LPLKKPRKIPQPFPNTYENLDIMGIDRSIPLFRLTPAGWLQRFDLPKPAVPGDVKEDSYEHASTDFSASDKVSKGARPSILFAPKLKRDSGRRARQPLADEKLEEMKKSLKELQSRLGRMESALEEKNIAVKYLQKDLAVLERNISGLRNDIAAAKIELKELKRKASDEKDPEMKEKLNHEICHLQEHQIESKRRSLNDCLDAKRKKRAEQRELEKGIRELQRQIASKTYQIAKLKGQISI
jgi:DNA repair exonuclease SbcCD ATPase subunit